MPHPRRACSASRSHPPPANVVSATRNRIDMWHAPCFDNPARRRRPRSKDCPKRSSHQRCERHCPRAPNHHQVPLRAANRFADYSAPRHARIETVALLFTGEHLPHGACHTTFRASEPDGHPRLGNPQRLPMPAPDAQPARPRPVASRAEWPEPEAPCPRALRPRHYPACGGK